MHHEGVFGAKALATLAALRNPISKGNPPTKKMPLIFVSWFISPLNSSHVSFCKYIIKNLAKNNFF